MSCKKRLFCLGLKVLTSQEGLRSNVMTVINRLYWSPRTQLLNYMYSRHNMQLLPQRSPVVQLPGIDNPSLITWDKLTWKRRGACNVRVPSHFDVEISNQWWSGKWISRPPTPMDSLDTLTGNNQPWSGPSKPSYSESHTGLRVYCDVILPPSK